MNWKPLCRHRGRLEGKLAIVTGANTGIGLETVAELARRGCRVVLACRSKERMENAVKNILERYSAKSNDYNEINFVPESKDCLTKVTEDLLIQMELDLSSVDSIVKFVDQFENVSGKIDFLINNAGLISTAFKQTKEGYELTMGTNHYGHCILTDLLIPRMTSGARIIMLSSKAHYYAKIMEGTLEQTEANYSGKISYCNSKLANVVHALYLKEKLKSKGIVTASVHPGVVKTEIFRDMSKALQATMSFFFGWAAKTPWEGCQTTMECVLTPQLTNGAYYSGCRVEQVNRIAEQNGFVDKYMKLTYAEIKKKLIGKSILERLNTYD